ALRIEHMVLEMLEVVARFECAAHRGQGLSVGGVSGTIAQLVRVRGQVEEQLWVSRAQSQLAVAADQRYLRPVGAFGEVFDDDVPVGRPLFPSGLPPGGFEQGGDRKSTRLNSSHVSIS